MTPFFPEIKVAMNPILGEVVMISIPSYLLLISNTFPSCKELHHSEIETRWIPPQCFKTNILETNMKYENVLWSNTKKLIKSENM